MTDENMLIQCSQCGEVNRLPVIHCKKCGAKLDFDAAERRMQSSVVRTWREQLGTGVRLAVAFLLLLALALLIWPGKLGRVTGEEMDARRGRMKKELLLDALNRGVPASQELEEGEVNAFLADLLRRQPAPEGSWSPVIKDVAVNFRAGRAVLFIAVRRGPFTFTGHFFARPEGGQLKVVGARAGHLPLPGVLGQGYALISSGVFRQMKDESRIMRNLDGVQVNAGSLSVLVAGRE